MKALFVSVLAAPAMLFFATSAYAQDADASRVGYPPPADLCPDGKCEVEFKGKVPEECTCTKETNGLLGAIKNHGTGFTDTLDSEAAGGYAATIFAKCNTGAKVNVAITTANVSGPVPGPFTAAYKINAAAAPVGTKVLVNNATTVKINAKLTGLTAAGDYLVKLTTTVSP
jgi:hypothetical protein